MRVTVQLDLGEGVFVPWYGSDALQVGDVLEHDGKGWKVMVRIWDSLGSLLTLRCVKERHEYAFHQTRKSEQPRLTDSPEVEN